MEILIYQNQQNQTQISVRLDAETVWLTQEQMSELFGRERSVITKHLRNIFKDGELDEESNVQILHIPGSDKPVRFYNLDTIISVGYRVNSKQGVQFRQWATRILRDHLVSGYTLNQTRLAERGLQEARETLELLARTLENQALVDDTGRAVLSLITGYANTWRTLLAYDEDRLSLPPGVLPAKGVLDYPTACAAIATFRKELTEATPLFGQERGESLQGILGSIEQTMFGEALYRSREEKAAHLLYFVIKDHPFSDGNKRIGSFLFMLYLQQEALVHRLNPQALTALTLLIAESAPTNKDLMIRLVMNLLTQG
ncbi:RhuM family protein [Candidatus Cyanaurora vandensis]|uniref:RhuM family protein n=1 Tax=Candidatus Cyanaurora vandensis TaxID=2714958 RepID=UPI00257C0CFE|nr:RhuM family protein [Candidatus Cyanaurora vandensis]